MRCFLNYSYVNFFRLLWFGGLLVLTSRSALASVHTTPVQHALTPKQVVAIRYLPRTHPSAVTFLELTDRHGARISQRDETPVVQLGHPIRVALELASSVRPANRQSVLVGFAGQQKNQKRHFRLGQEKSEDKLLRERSNAVHMCDLGLMDAVWPDSADASGLYRTRIEREFIVSQDCLISLETNPIAAASGPPQFVTGAEPPIYTFWVAQNPSLREGVGDPLGTGSINDVEYFYREGSADDILMFAKKKLFPKAAALSKNKAAISNGVQLDVAGGGRTEWCVDADGAAGCPIGFELQQGPVEFFISNMSANGAQFSGDICSDSLDTSRPLVTLHSDIGVYGANWYETAPVVSAPVSVTASSTRRLPFESMKSLIRYTGSHQVSYSICGGDDCAGPRAEFAALHVRDQKKGRSLLKTHFTPSRYFAGAPMTLQNSVYGVRDTPACAVLRHYVKRSPLFTLRACITDVSPTSPDSSPQIPQTCRDLPIEIKERPKPSVDSGVFDANWEKTVFFGHNLQAKLESSTSTYARHETTDSSTKFDVGSTSSSTVLLNAPLFDRPVRLATVQFGASASDIEPLTSLVHGEVSLLPDFKVGTTKKWEQSPTDRGQSISVADQFKLRPQTVTQGVLRKGLVATIGQTELSNYNSNLNAVLGIDAAIDGRIAVDVDDAKLTLAESNQKFADYPRVKKSELGSV